MFRSIFRLNPLKFQNIWLFIPTLTIIFFGIQSIVGLFYLGGSASWQVIWIILVGILSYITAYWFFKSSNRYKPTPFFISSTGIERALIIIAVAYFTLILYLCATVEKIAILDALQGATALEISESREMFFRTRSGVEKSLVYIFTIFSSAVMPYFLMMGFINKIKIALPIFILFLISLLLSMEKALLMKAMLPIFLISLNGYFPKKWMIISPLIIALVLLSMTYLARGSDDGKSVGTISTVAVFPSIPNEIDLDDRNSSYDERDEMNQRLGLFQGGKQLTLGQHIRKYYPLRGKTGFGFLVNRIVWIPYITAYDWIKYFHEEMNGEHALGKTSSFISTVLGEKKVPVEQYVFDYQFGLGPTQTAGANANFMVDAFVNFGWIGVFLIPVFMGWAVSLIESLNNPAASAGFYFYLLQLLGGGFLGSFLGGGLAIYILIICIFQPQKYE